MNIPRLDAAAPDFDAQLARLLDRTPEQDARVAETAAQIIADVRARGDAALLEYTNRFDGSAWTAATQLELTRDDLATAWVGLPMDLRRALEKAHARIRAYAEHQPLKPFEFGDHYGNRLGQRITPLDLGFAKCRLVVAAAKSRRQQQGRLRVATKYPEITRRHFGARGEQVEIIKLYGSMELAPLVGLADLIVDLVDTGNTLRANGLVEVETIAPITARLVVNKAAMKMKHAAIRRWLERFRAKATGELA